VPVSLPLLWEQVERRCQTTLADHSFWPCSAGCDDCCRKLAEVPRFTRSEWHELRAAIGALGVEVRAAVSDKVAALALRTAQGQVGPVVCPLLDTERGMCRVYSARPLACRTYGFYAEGADGKHCDKVSQAVAAHPDAAIVWGHEPAIFRQAEKDLGMVQTLIDWWPTLHEEDGA
jgi:Fe-S-cluster containining protein